MKFLLTLHFAASLLALALAQGESAECPTLTPEDLAKLKELTVKEDIHDQLVGEFGSVWGPKSVVAVDENTSIYFTRQKINDKELLQTTHMTGKWFGGERTKNGTLKKVDNGIYIAHSSQDIPLAKFYFLFSQNNVTAHFICFLPNAKPTDQEAKLPTISGVTVRRDLLTSALSPEVQMAVREAVSKIEGSKDVLGEISETRSPVPIAGVQVPVIP